MTNHPLPTPTPTLTLLPTLITLITLIISISAQLSCTNYYSQSNLPSQCYSNSTCVFPPLSNSTLFVNTTIDSVFGLCIDLPAYTITIEPGIDMLNESVYINCSSISFQPGYSLQSKSSVVVQASNDITLSNVSMTASFIWLQSNQLQLVNTSIINDGSFSTDCDCTSKATICTAPKYDFPFLYSEIKYPSPFDITLLNYTFQSWIFNAQGTNSAVLYARNNITISNSTIRISVIAIYSLMLSITTSSLDNSGLGYSSGTGLGCGYFDQLLNQLLGCTGTGASHGGYGGNSQPENCNLLLSRPPYDRDSIPKYPGSGGGFFLKSLTEVSAGGGVINIQVQSLIIQSSNIRADGTNGIQGGGGGSGGSVSIDFLNVRIINAPNISANGGAGKSSGGGGRIRYFYHGWNRVGGNRGDSNNLMVVANGGDCLQGKLSCGQRGSIDVAPCPPGYYLSYINYGCNECSTGTHQLTYSYSSCSSCSIKPANSVYSNVTSHADLSNYMQVCSFECIDDYSLYNNRECLSSFNYMLADVGGINIIICIGIIVATIVIYLIILMVRKLSFSDRNLFNQTEPVDIDKKKSYFKIQDIPFHEMRIFFEGYNSPSNPWRIHQKVEAKLSELEEYHSNFPFFSRLIREINLIGEYNRPTKWLLYILKFTYYPLGLFLASAFRVHKSKQLRRLIVDKYKQNTQLHLGIKLHVNTQHTVASLELFNFQKETLDFYIKNYFPIHFKLQKLHGGGYSIDLTDPIFKSLCNEFEEKDEKNIKLEDYLIELNQLLRNSDQELPIFKHLWKIHNAWPFLQCHLWQPENNILGVGDNMRINKSQDLFLVFSTELRPQNLAININQSLPGSQLILQSSRGNQSKVSRHFLSRNELPNIYFDEISCIRHKYHLREAMVEMDQKKTIFWQIENSFSEKSLSWLLGAIDILQLLLNLLSFFLVVFSLDQHKNSFVYAYIPYFILFPFCEYFMIFLEFNLLISRVTRVFTFALYFTLFSLVKFLILCIIMLPITVPNGGSQDTIFIISFFLWIMILIFNIVSLVLLCMLQTHYTKVK